MTTQPPASSASSESSGPPATPAPPAPPSHASPPASASGVSPSSPAAPSGDAARRAARAARGRAYGLFVLATVGAALCVGISHGNPAALGAGAVLVVVSAVGVTWIERRLRTMDQARRSRLVSGAGFAGLAAALVVPFLLPPEWAIVLGGPPVGGLVALGLVMLHRSRLPE